VADSQTFLDKYPQNPLAADVLMWLGDHASNNGAAEEGENAYLQVPTRFPESPLAPVALLEAAKSALQRRDQVRAVSLTGQLFRDYASTMSPPTLAKAELLQGDLLASQGQFAEAIPHFSRIPELVPKTPLAAAASGRLGEMHYSLSDGKQENLNQAVAIFQELVTRDGAPFPEREKARYRLAKAYEKLGQVDKAIKEYLEIVYQYDLEVKAGRVRDWYYFARSGYDVARLLVFSERFLEAARIYERLAAAKIPTSEEALAKAREIRAAHKLQD
jgi:TolA-binding protein